MSKGLKGLPGLSAAAEQAFQNEMDALDSRAYREYITQETNEYVRNNYLYEAQHPLPAVRPISIGDLPKDFGESRYDKHLNTLEDIADYENQRGYQQGPGIQLLNGVIKGVSTAGTTFVSGTLGTVWGIVHGLNKAINDDYENPNLSGGAEFLGGFVNNPVNLRMQEFSNFMEQFAPNYRTFEEQNTPWYRRAFKGSMMANFWGNDIVTNIGFSVGALAAGMAWSKGLLPLPGKGLKAIKKLVSPVSDDIAKAFNNPTVGSKIIAGLQSGENLSSPLTFMTKAAKRAKGMTGETINTGLSLLLGATGEAQIEALQGATEFRNAHLKRASKYYKETRDQRLIKFMEDNPQYLVNGQLSPLGQEAFEKSEKQTFDGYRQQVEDEAIRVGNNIFVYETALLTITNAAVYSKLFGAGYKTQSAIATKNVKLDPNTGKYIANKVRARWGSGYGFVKGTAMEGVEEWGQGGITAASKKYSENILGNTLYHEDLNDQYANDKMANIINSLGAGWDAMKSEQGGLEFFSGAIMGILGVPTIGRRRSGKTGVILTGGLPAGIREAKDKAKLRDAAIANLNDYLSKPENKELFKAAVLNQKYSEAMQKALEESSPLSFKDNEHKAIMSMAMAFQSVNKMDDFYNMVDEFTSPTDEQIKEIKEQATLDPKTGESVYGKMTNDEVKGVISKQATDLKTRVKAFIDLNNSLTTLYGKDFSRETITGLAFDLSLAENKRQRSTELANEIKDALNSMLPIEDHIIDTKNYQQIRKALETFGEINKAKETVAARRKVDQVYADTENQTSVNAQILKEKFNLSPYEADEFISNIQEKSYQLLSQDAVKNAGIGEKIMDLYVNIMDANHSMVMFTQAISNPKKYMKDIAEKHVNAVKERRVQFIKDLGELEDEVEYTQAINGLKPEDRDEFLAEHIVTNAKAKPFAEKILVNKKLVDAVDTILNDSESTLPQEARDIVKKIFEDNKDALYASVKDGLVEVEKAVNEVQSPSVLSVLATIKSKLATIEEINNFYKAKAETQSDNNLGVSKLSEEEIKLLKEQAVKVAKELMLFRAKVTGDEALFKVYMSRKSTFSPPFTVQYINPADMEEVTAVESEGGRNMSVGVDAKMRIRVDYATNRTQLYILKPSVAKALGSDSGKFEEYAEKTPATYEVSGWGFTEDQLKAGLQSAGVKLDKLEGAYDIWKSPFYYGDIKGNGGEKNKGLFKIDWSNVSVAGDEMLQDNYNKLIKQLEDGVKPATTENTPQPNQPQPVDDFITIEQVENRDVVTGYKLTIENNGNKTYTVYSRDKKGKDTKTLYSYIPMIPSAIDPVELNKLPDSVAKAKSVKLHKVYEKQNTIGGIDFIGELVGANDVLTSVKLQSNYILDAKERKDKAQANKLVESKYSGSTNLTVSEYSFRNEDEGKAAPTPITNERDKFIYEVFKARGTYDFINSGKLHELWSKDKNLPIKFMKINSASDSSLITLKPEDAVYFMYIDYEGKQQIVGNVKKGSDLETALDKDPTITRTIRDFSAGHKALDETVYRPIAEVTNSNTPPTLALITANKDQSAPVLDAPAGTKIQLDQIRGLQGLEWKKYVGKPLTLVPTADGTYIPIAAITRGFDNTDFVIPKSNNELMVNDSSPVANRINTAIKEIASVTYIQGQNYDNETYIKAKDAINTLNKLLKFRDPNGKYYSIDLYYSEEQGSYWVAVHLDGTNAKRRMTTEELKTFDKYKSDVVNAEVPEAQSDGEITEDTRKSLTDFINAQYNKRATITLSEGDFNNNYRQLLALITALNPMFNYSTQAFNEDYQGLTVKDWVDHKLLLTTLKLPRSYNGRFFLNDETPADMVSTKEASSDPKEEYFNIGFKAGTSLGYNVGYSFNGTTLIIKSISTATGSDAKKVDKVFGVSEKKFIDLSDKQQLAKFEESLREALQTNVALSEYAQKNPNGTEFFFDININGEEYCYIVNKEYNKKNELIHKKENTRRVASREALIDLFDDMMLAYEETPSITENENVIITPVEEVQEEMPSKVNTSIDQKKADIEKRRQDAIDNLFSRTQASVDKKLNTPVQKLSKEEINKNIEASYKQNKDLIEELEEEFKKNTENNVSDEVWDEWEDKATKLDNNLPPGVTFRVINGKIELIDNQSYRDINFGGNRVVQVSTATLHSQTEEFQVGDSLQVHDGVRALPAIVTKVNKNGKVLEAKTLEGRILISKGNIITTAPINEMLKIQNKYESELAALESQSSKVEPKQVDVKFNYSGKLQPTTKLFNPSNKKEITLEDYIKQLEAHENPMSAIDAYSRIISNKAILNKIGLTAEDFQNLISELKSYMETYTRVNNPKEDDIQDICKKQ